VSREQDEPSDGSQPLQSTVALSLNAYTSLTEPCCPITNTCSVQQGKRVSRHNSPTTFRSEL